MTEKKKPAKKAAAKKPAAKKPASKQPASKKPAAKKQPAKKPAEPRKRPAPKNIVTTKPAVNVTITTPQVEVAPIIESITTSTVVRGNDIKNPSLRQRVLKWFKRDD